MGDGKLKARAWMREIEVIFTSTKLKQRMTFGTNSRNGKQDLNIQVTGTKYLSSLKDRFTVTITNLTYKEITELISGEFFDIEIKAGYRTSGIFTVFKGGVLFISNVLGDRKSNDVVVLCASKMVAQYGQARMNLSLNSGINMYGALNYILNFNGISNAYIDDDFKARITKENMLANKSINSWLDTLCESEGFAINTDSSFSSDVAIWNPARTDFRRIVLESTTIILTAGYPTLTSEGLNMSVMPTFNFVPGDVIVVDNSIIDIGITDENAAYKNYGQFLDKENSYIIYQIDVTLENRGSDFSYKMLCKAKSLWSNLFKGGA